MFKKKDEIKTSFGVEPTPLPKQAPSLGEERTFIGKGVKIKGELSSEEDMIIEGRVEGKIETKKTLIVGKSGNIEGEIKANEVRIMGKVTGDIHATTRIEIVPSGAHFGNIFSPRVAISEGAIFKGNIDMQKQEKEIQKPEVRQGKKEQEKSSSE
ncbi:MAG: bactofilin family protein [Candidatus Aminicenantia bacterium]